MRPVLSQATKEEEAPIKPSLTIQLAFLSILGGYYGLSNFVALPELAGSVVVMLFLFVVPVLIGQNLLLLGKEKTKSNSSNLDACSRLTFFWAFGALIIFQLVTLSWALGQRNLFGIMIIVLVSLLLGLVRSYRLAGDHEQTSVSPRSKLTFCFLLIAVFAIALSSFLFFRSRQPFPTYMTAEFAYFGKPIQLIDGLDEYRIAERAPYPIFQTCLALGSWLFEIHPLAAIWTSTLGLLLIIAAGFFLLAQLLFRNYSPALMAAFLGMWVFAGSPVHNAPYVLSSANVQYAFFVLSLYIVTRRLVKRKADINKRILPLTFGLPALIVFQRVVFGYDSIAATLAISILLSFLLFCLRGHLLKENENQFSLILLLLFSFLSILHPFMAVPLYILPLCAYIILWKAIMSNPRTRNKSLFSFILISGVLLFFIFQVSGLLVFNDNFTLSRYIFGDLYVGVPGVDIGFADKLAYLVNGNTALVLCFYIIGGVIIVMNSVRAPRNETLIIAMSALTFFVYFFPEGWFVRARFVIPFFVLVIAGGANIMIILVNRFLGRDR